MKNITIFAIIVIAAALVDMLGAHVVLELANLYSLSFITDFSFIQVFGLLFVASIFTYKYEKDTVKTEKESEKWYIPGFTKVATTAIHYLLIWGIGSLMFSILS